MDDRNEFEREARGARLTFAGELFRYIRHTRKYWLVPIILIMVVLGLLIVLAGTGSAPFIYTVF